MAKKKAKSKRPKSKQRLAKDVVMWIRLPKAVNLTKLKALGIEGAACYGGDTCIAATAPNAKAGIILQGDLGEMLKKAGLTPRAACFGGDTCIV